MTRFRVTIAGAGVAALEALLALRHLAADRVDIDLVAPSAEFVYRPLTVLEPFGAGPAPRFPLGKLVREHGAGHVFDAVEAVDAGRHIFRTRSGEEYAYQALVVATGAQIDEAVPGSLTFPGPAGVEQYRALLAGLAGGEVHRLVFAVPAASAWALPLYELALLTAGWLAERSAPRVRLVVVTPERAPLAAFGERAAASVADLLAERGVELRPRATPERASSEGLILTTGEVVAADRVVALPRLRGPQIAGLPGGDDKFVAVDEHGCVRGLTDVYAAGDATAWPMKQGGLAAQQAVVVAEALAERAGAPVRPTAYHPVLRGVLLTGSVPAYLRSDMRGDRTRSIARVQPLWWPPAKVAGRYLAPYLAARGVSLPPPLEF